MKIRDVMTGPLETINADAPIKAAAQKMKINDIGSLPVRDGQRLVGFVTDRDIVIRGDANSRASLDTPVREVMSPEVVCCFEDQELAEATKVMEEKKIRRLPIVDREMRPVGMLSLGDVAKRGKDAQMAGSLLRKVAKAPSDR